MLEQELSVMLHALKQSCTSYCCLCRLRTKMAAGVKGVVLVTLLVTLHVVAGACGLSMQHKQHDARAAKVHRAATGSVVRTCRIRPRS